MSTSRFNQPAFDEWLAEQPSQAHQLIRQTRDAIIASDHNFTEGIKWGSPCYWLPEISRRTITWIQHHNNYVRLGFFNGATMPDPHNFLEGTGKNLRHIKIYQITQNNRQTLTNYVRTSTNLAITAPNSLSG